MIRQLATTTLAAAAIGFSSVAASAAPPTLFAAPVPLNAPAPSAAAPTPAAPHAVLTLTVTASDPAARTAPVRLTCGPDGGTHPSPSAACAALRKSRGDVFGLPPRQGVLCTADYRPVVASVTGRWGLRKISAKRTFSNACQLGIATGVLFAPRKPGVR